MIYQRKTPVFAIQFSEVEFNKNSLNYPEVWDRAMTIKSWWNKTAKDGRYYIINQPNTYSSNSEYITVDDGDYLVREELGIVHTYPKGVFEKNFEAVEGLSR